MAEVFKATLERDSFSKTVALKRMHPFLACDPGTVRLFVREAELTAKLDHSNIVRIYDFGTLPSDGLPFIAMEFVDGNDLKHLLHDACVSGRQIQVLEAVLIAQEVSKALAYAHGERTGLPPITHRDISPANILISRAGEVKLSDFGVAKVYGVDTTQNVVKGKVAYMSPEQLRGEPVDGRSDIFSLGAVLWETLTLKRLWEAPNDLAAVEVRRVAPPPDPPSKHNPEVPPALDQVVLKCLEVDREKRFATASELAAALEGVLGDLGTVGRSRDEVLASLVNELAQGNPGTGILKAPAPAPSPSPANVTKNDLPKLQAPASGPAQVQKAGAYRWVLWAGPMALLLAAALAFGLYMAFGGQGGKTSEPGAGPERTATEGQVAPAPIPDPGYGTLSLDSIPWAEVFWKGESLGTTPIMDRKLPAGVVELVLRNEPAGLVKTVKVQIRKGEKTQETVNLKSTESR